MLFMLALALPGPVTAVAQEAPPPAAEAAPADKAQVFRATELPLPRFVSLRAGEVYVRTGPGQRYPVEWVYKRSGIPVEIILEYDIWRKIRDYDGKVGWVHHTMLSGKRTAFIKGEDRVNIHKKPFAGAEVLAAVEPGVTVDVTECAQSWCAINATGYKGWVPQTALWGVYESEEFD